MEQGGLWVHSGDPEFSESILRHSSGEFGGITKIESGASLSLKGSFVHDGVAQQGGGVAWVAEGGAFRADNSLFFANRSLQGAQFIDGQGDISLDYSTSWSPVGECINASSLSSSHTVVWGEGSCSVSATSLSLARSNFKGLPAGEGNLAAEPIFANAAAPFGEDNILGSLDDGLIPKEGSPLIDGGAAMPDSVTIYDIRGVRRGFDGDGNGVNRADIGAYEFFRLTDRASLLGHLPGGQFKPDDGKAFIMFADCVDRQKRIFSRSNAGYVIQLRHAPNKHLQNRGSFYGDLVALDSNMKVIPNAPEMKVTFYAAGMDSETGELLFQSRTATNGAPFVMTGSKECHEVNKFGMFMYAPYGNFQVTVPYKQFR